LPVYGINNRMEEDSTPITPVFSTQTQLAHDEYLMIQSWRPCWYNLECEGQTWTVVSEARERAYCRRILQRWIFGMLHAERQHTCRAAWRAPQSWHIVGTTHGTTWRTATTLPVCLRVFRFKRPTEARMFAGRVII
jgi:hypothetical protein